MGGVTFNTSPSFPGTEKAVCRYGEVFFHFGVPPWALTEHHAAVAAAVPLTDSVLTFSSSYLCVAKIKFKPLNVFVLMHI